ncbi:MAG: hypothetical protein IJK45_09980 [Bacteroidaceae bacterium]|nr:hypothetical protein [Bacteroidaceae bacterium]
MRPNYVEINTQEQLAEVLAGPTDVPLRRLAFHGVNFREMPEQALGHQYRECIFLACQLPHGFKSRLTDSLVFPDMGELFRFQTELYTADTLYEGYEVGQPETIEKCFDGRVYKHYLERGKQSTDIKETLARTLHDHSISNALHHFLDNYRETDIVGVMGGHGMLRTDVHYRQIAQISKTLTEKGKLMISGGGPGAMEATHLGAWMAGRSQKELDEALALISQVPSFSDTLWLDTAFQVREKFPQTQGYKSLGIPTWLYGHEPSTPLATHIAKYFDNSIREDGILTIAKGGIIFTPGSAGTLQEIFQDAVQNHYMSFGYASPMVFMDKDYWQSEVPVYPLIQDLVGKGRYKNLILAISDDCDEIVEEIMRFTPPCGNG